MCVHVWDMYVYLCLWSMTYKVFKYCRGKMSLMYVTIKLFELEQNGYDSDREGTLFID